MNRPAVAETDLLGFGPQQVVRDTMNLGLNGRDGVCRWGEDQVMLVVAGLRIDGMVS